MINATDQFDPVDQKDLHIHSRVAETSKEPVLLLQGYRFGHCALLIG